MTTRKPWHPAERPNDDYDYTEHWKDFQPPHETPVKWRANWNPALPDTHRFVPHKYLLMPRCSCKPGPRASQRPATRSKTVTILRIYRGHGPDDLTDVLQADPVDIFMCERCYALELQQERDSRGPTGDENRHAPRK